MRVAFLHELWPERNLYADVSEASSTARSIIARLFCICVCCLSVCVCDVGHRERCAMTRLSKGLSLPAGVQFACTEAVFSSVL